MTAKRSAAQIGKTKAPKAGDGFTQFGRAMTDLNINVICANTPAAKSKRRKREQHRYGMPGTPKARTASASNSNST
jgi:hypothetical protein